jgi:hypothetical protein
MHLYISVYNKKNISRKIKTTSNLGWKKYITNEQLLTNIICNDTHVLIYGPINNVQWVTYVTVNTRAHG